jgi:hypothetical protein
MICKDIRISYEHILPPNTLLGKSTYDNIRESCNELCVSDVMLWISGEC